ncbi:MAG: FtsW/RodA/SpoVE family cell cycle protein [Actinomycetota bacterium]|nr:FtsW/RodA/SpoVE family cell cycle protein [Actinomycetota bacterium]
MQALVQDRPTPTWLALARRLDLVLVAVTLALAAYGSLIVYSATKVPNQQAGIGPTYYFVHQAAYDVVGLVAMLLTMSVGYRRLVRLGLIVYGFLLVALVAVMAVGSSTLGSQRWFSIGPFQLQPSAFASVGLVLALTAAIDRWQERITARRLVALVVMAVVPILLVFKQPDLGSAILMLVTSAAVMVVGGVKGRHLVILVLLGLATVVAALQLHLLHSYQLSRLTSFLHQNSNATFRTSTYNIQQSKYAISSGGLAGKGLFRGSEITGGYVPAFSTDFIFSAVGEQLGFLGSSVLLVLYSILSWRIWRAAARSGDRLGRLCAAGVLALLGFSVFENVGMTMGIMPVAGIPLPLVSYGGSAVVNTFMAVGLVASIGLEPSH